MSSSCSVKLSTIVDNKIGIVPNKENSAIIYEFYNYMQERGSSENHQVNNLKVVINFANFLGPNITFYNICKKEQITSFLNTKIKSSDIDPDKKWITTWNHFLNRIKLFMRWLYNYHYRLKQNNIENNFSEDINDNNNEWITPEFCKIKPKQTKRISPYLESEIWEKDELLTIIKYEPYKRNKAILALMWDLDARPHEITLLRIKHVRLKERYGEGEIPYEAKTGTGPILLTTSFPYVRDWLNEHPFKNEPTARLICNQLNGGALKPKSIWNMMKQLEKRIKRLLENGEINDKNEREKLEYLLKTKKWNPYCIRHSAITSDSDYLPEYALKKKVRWSMNSKQGTRYIKRRMGDELKTKILQRNGIMQETEMKAKPIVSNCPKCELVNAIENKYCSKCSYPLKPEAYDEIKDMEEKRIQTLEQKYENDMRTFRDDMNKQLSEMMLMIQQNPKLSYIKPEILEKINDY
jgi:integrase/recombinase XerD